MYTEESLLEVLGGKTIWLRERLHVYYKPLYSPNLTVPNISKNLESPKIKVAVFKPTERTKIYSNRHRHRTIKWEYKFSHIEEML